VAAILNFFCHSMRQVEVDHLGAAPKSVHRGDAQVGSAERFETPLLRGEPRHRLARGVPAAFGGTRPPRHGR
jgi:hypothetical protein